MSDRSEKLKPEEKSLYRRVYLARVHEGASVESADRQAMQAVKIWHDRGAFGEPTETKHVSGDEAWSFITEWLCDSYDQSKLTPTGVASLMRSYGAGKLLLDELRDALDQSIVNGSRG